MSRRITVRCAALLVTVRSQPDRAIWGQRVEVARAGVEPATSHFSGERYYQLSYLAKQSDDTSPMDGIAA